MRSAFFAIFAAAMACAWPWSGQAQEQESSRCEGSDGYMARGGKRTFLWTPAMLAAARAELSADLPAKARLISDANEALDRGPYAVTDKTKLPPSGDKHDYQSIGPYWWPSPGKPGGLPYARRDGRINPERSGPEYDLSRLEDFSHDVTLLSLAYAHTQDLRYAHHAARLLRAWFLDPATRMNPNLAHAQAVPGREAGRAEGIIDATRLVPVVESVGLLGPSNVLTAEENAGLENWFGDLVQWMATSPNGRKERAKYNNHGIYFDMLIGEFALFARLEPVARTIAERFGVTRIEPQIAADGTFPQELARTRSWHYTLWTLDAGIRMTQIGNCVGIDISAYRNAAGAGLSTALDLTAAVRDPEMDWQWPELAFGDPEKMSAEDALAATTFRAAAWYLRNPRFERVAKRFQPSAANDYTRYFLGPYTHNLEGS